MIKCGVFKYSKEDGTPAAKLKGQVHHATKEKRYKLIMELQKQISKDSLEKQIGKVHKVLIEQKSFDNKYYIGRSAMDVADVDGIIYIKNDGVDLLNKFVNCKITDVNDYDLIADLEEKDD